MSNDCSLITMCPTAFLQAGTKTKLQSWKKQMVGSWELFNLQGGNAETGLRYLYLTFVSAEWNSCLLDHRLSAYENVSVIKEYKNLRFGRQNKSWGYNLCHAAKPSLVYKQLFSRYAEIMYMRQRLRFTLLCPSLQHLWSRPNTRSKYVAKAFS